MLMPCTGSYSKQIQNFKAKNIKQEEWDYEQDVKRGCANAGTAFDIPFQLDDEKSGNAKKWDASQSHPH